MRALFPLLLVVCGCLHVTPTTTAVLLDGGETRVDASLSYALQPGLRVRHGILDGVQVGGRADVVGFEDVGVVVGPEVAVRLRRPVSGAPSVVAALGASHTVWFGPDHLVGMARTYVYPTVLIGSERVYGGFRVSVPLGEGVGYAGPVAGVRYRVPVVGVGTRLDAALLVPFSRPAEGSILTRPPLNLTLVFDGDG